MTQCALYNRKDMKIDGALSKYDKREFHKIIINANAERVYDVIRRLNFGDSWVVRLLFKLRGIPAKEYSVPELIGMHFNVLVEDEPNELVIGLIGKFWLPFPKLQHHNLTTFREFEGPGYAKVVWNFHVTTLTAGKVLLTTETRGRGTDRASKAAFAIYWLIIRPFSGKIREKMLLSAKYKAERI